MTRLVIARHGNTFEDGEPPRRIGAATDLPLTARGRDQARRLGEGFANAGIAFDGVLTGPLARVRETAALILAGLADPPPAAIEPWLNEVDHGPDENLIEEAVRERHGSAALDLWDRCALPPAGWTVDAEARIEWWRGLMARPATGNTLLVTSNGAARFALLALLADPRLASSRLRTGAWGSLVRGIDGAWRVECWDERPDPGP